MLDLLFVKGLPRIPSEPRISKFEDLDLGSVRDEGQFSERSINEQDGAI